MLSRNVRRRGLSDGAIEPDQRRPDVDLGIDRSKHFSHCSRARSSHRSFHFHGLEHGDRGAGLDVFASLDVYRHQHCRYRCTYYSCLVAPDAVSYAFDLDRLIVPAGYRHDMEQ